MVYTACAVYIDVEPPYVRIIHNLIQPLINGVVFRCMSESKCGSWKILIEEWLSGASQGKRNLNKSLLASRQSAGATGCRWYGTLVQFGLFGQMFPPHMDIKDAISLYVGDRSVLT